MCKNNSKDTSSESHRRIQSQVSSVQDRTLHKWVGMESHSGKSVKNQPKRSTTSWIGQTNIRCPIAHLLQPSMSILQTFVKTKSSAFSRSVMTGSSLLLVLPILVPCPVRITLLNFFMNVLYSKAVDPLFSACKLIPSNETNTSTTQRLLGDM